MYLTVIQKNPTYLEISFINKNTIYAYSLLADLGLFGDTSADRKTIEEKLFINKNRYLPEMSTWEYLSRGSKKIILNHNQLNLLSGQ